MPIDPRALGAQLPPQPLRLWTPDPVEPLSGGLEYAGHGFPARQGESGTPRNGWERFTRGMPLGKKAVLLYNADVEGEQFTGVPFLQLRSDDCDAQPVTLVIAPPRVIAMNFDDVITNENLQNLSGDQDNVEVSDQDFPGDTTPITWPPLQVKIRWGSAGVTPNEALVDVMNGVTVNLSASFIEASGIITQMDDSGIGGTSAAYALSAIVAPGYTRPGNAQCTVYCGDVDAGAESVIFRVPRFAKRAWVLSNDSAVAPGVTIATLRFWQSVLGAGVAGASNVGNVLVTGNQYQPANVPNGGLYFSVLNGGSTARFAVIFDLSI